MVDEPFVCEIVCVLGARQTRVNLEAVRGESQDLLRVLYLLRI